MNVVIVEDSELISSQIRHLLSREPRIHVTGVATEESSAIDMILSTRPDAVLLDLCLSPGSGIQVLQKIRDAKIGSLVFVLTNSVEDAIRQKCEALGISGFFDKSKDVDECFDTLFALLPVLPADEADRLQEVRATRLLDTPEQEAFDAIARLARDVTETPIALVSLMDEKRQWYLAHLGIDVRETSRSVTVCAHTILGNELLEIPDLTQDARFANYPGVVGEPNIRFYAGVPLVLPSGHVLGTLCVLDTKARELTDAQRATLKTLAHSVVVEIEMRRKIVALEFEVERRHAAEERVLELATRDMLTQLPNRMALHDRLGQQVRHSARDGTKFAFLFIDLDRFKLINDTLGHEAGDLALAEIAKRLTSTLRESDTVARLGGDEFAAILANIGDAGDAMALAQKVNLALKQSTVLCGTELHYDASIGIAVYTDHADNVHDLIRRADLAMYRAKSQGGGCSVLFDEALEVNSSQLLSLEYELEQALQRHEIIAYYQPQIALDGKGITGVEALARWKHPRLGLLGSAEFIPFAESRNRLQRIGLRMIDLATAQLAQWDLAGLQVPVVAVNMSLSEITPELLAAVQSALERNNLAAHRFEIEITESVLGPDHAEVISLLTQLRGLGVRVSLDDFGSGYSSLSQLRTLPIDALKIARSFVTDTAGHASSSVIVTAIVQMARSLGLTIVAEGAESDDQLSQLRNIGCDSVQGFVHTPPLPPEEFARWSEQFNHRNQHQSKSTRVAVLEGTPEMSARITTILTGLGYSVDAYSDGQAFLERAQLASYDTAILDLSLPDNDFLELLKKRLGTLEPSPLLLVSGNSSSVLEAAALFASARGLQVKGILSMNRPPQAA